MTYVSRVSTLSNANSEHVRDPVRSPKKRGAGASPRVRYLLPCLAKYAKITPR